MQRAAFRIGLVIAAITLPMIFVTSDERFARLWQLPSIDPFLTNRFRQRDADDARLHRHRHNDLPRHPPRAATSPAPPRRHRDRRPRATRHVHHASHHRGFLHSAARRTSAGSEPEPVRIYSYAGRLRTTTERKPLPFGVQRWIVRNGMIPSSEMTWGFEGMLDLDVTSTHLLPTVHFENLFNAALTHRRLAPRLPLLLQMSGVTHVGFQKDYDPAVLADPARFDAVDPVEFVATRNAGPFYVADRLLTRRRHRPHRLLRTSAFHRERHSPTSSFRRPPARVLASRVSPNRVAVDVEASGRSFLTLAVTRHKYWSATIDGAPATIHPANVAFQGVVIEPGRHHLELITGIP